MQLESSCWIWRRSTAKRKQWEWACAWENSRESFKASKIFSDFVVFPNRFDPRFFGATGDSCLPSLTIPFHQIITNRLTYSSRQLFSWQRRHITYFFSGSLNADHSIIALSSSIIGIIIVVLFFISLVKVVVRMIVWYSSLNAARIYLWGPMLAKETW